MDEIKSSYSPFPKHEPAQHRGSRHLIVVFLLILFFIGVPAAGFFYFMNVISEPHGDSSEEVHFVIAPGQGAEIIAGNLKAEGLIDSAFMYKIYLWASGDKAHLQAGEYDIPENSSMVDLTKILSEGEIVSNEVKITLPEGLTAAEMAEIFDNEGVIDSSAFIEISQIHDSRELLPDETYTFFKDKPEDQAMEGYLFPDTYYFYRGSSQADVLKKFLDNFGVKAGDALMDASQQGKNVYDVITLASIVEAEAQKYDDKRIIAGIFAKRIKEGMPLQSDATVNYATGKSALQPTLQDLKVTSPYNTYMFKGLPPGPINNPGYDSIKAVLNQKATKYYYFLTTPENKMIYSETYEEHLMNKEEYL